MGCYTTGRKKPLVGILAVAALYAVLSLFQIPSVSTNLPLYSTNTENEKKLLPIPVKMSSEFRLFGGILNNQGVHTEFWSDVVVSLVHSYSPNTENHFKEMMVDPDRDQHRVFANSPAIMQLDNGEIITVMRIWLEKEIWSMMNINPSNTFSDNYFYVQTFDNYMKPTTKGRILGIPTPIQWALGDGPIEPRIFRVNKTIYLTFNTGVFSGKKPIDSTFIWDMTNSRALMPHIHGGHPMIDKIKDKKMPRDKHWSALVNGSQLYFTYNLDPLRVIDCHLKQEASCHFVHKEGPDDWSFNDNRDAIRGGTPFVLYKYPYYISVAHGTFFQKCEGPIQRCNYQRYYTIHLIVITVEPSFKVIYISRNINLPKASLNIPIVRYRYIKESFFFPVGLILESEDSIVIGGHINDHSSVLYRVSGISNIMQAVVKYDTGNRHLSGPLPGMLHNYTRVHTEKESGLTFHRE